MINHKSLSVCITKGLQWLKAGRYHKAVTQLRRCPSGVQRDLALAEALLGDESNTQRVYEAYQLLLAGFYDFHSSLSVAQRKHLLQQLVRCASRVDPELAALIEGIIPPLQLRDRARRLLKEFYFGGAKGRSTCGEVVQSALRKLDGRTRQHGTFLSGH